MVKQKTEWLCTGIKAIVLIQDLEYIGSFNSSDEFLNQIWKIGAYTVHLCLQDYLWDGIKRRPTRLDWRYASRNSSIKSLVRLYANY